ncbi:MAG TPA: PadR family transcriptional regulator [Thermoleophilaceae bacterium]|nr:PadR family transcriptional regulator [Thermoleophilaceae bacterium]
MALRHALLAALAEGEASGYELAKRFDVSVANFWAATPQQLYRELDRLESQGLVRGRTVRQRKRPDKRVFRPTAAGREELAAFTAAPARPTAIRDELLVKLQAVDSGDAGAVRDAIAVRMDEARAKLAAYEALIERLLAGRSEDDYLAAGGRIGPYLTLLRGRSFEQENLRWGEHALAVLTRPGVI